MLVVVQLLCLTTWLTEGQEDTAAVYIGTGVNGSMETRNNEIVIMLGGLFPVHRNSDSRCGEILDLGVQRLEAMVLATEKINKDSSFLPGVTLAYEIRDTCVRPNRALEQSLNYVTERTLTIGNETNVPGVSGVVGAASSGVSIDTANLLRLFDIPQISYASTAKTLSDKTRFDYFFRTVPPDSLQAQAMVDIVEYFNWTYVIAMHSGDTYGSEGIREFIDQLEAKRRNSTRKCVAATIEVTDNFNQAIEEMNKNWVRNATVVVLFGQLATAIGVLEAVERKQMIDPEFASRDFTWIGSDAWGDQIPARLYSVAKGSLSVIPRALLSTEFDTYFESLHPSDNSANPWFEEYWEFVFNCTFANRVGFQPCDVANQAIGPMSNYRQNSKVTFTIDAVYAFAHAIHKLQQDFCQGGPGLCEEILDDRAGGKVVRGELLLKYLQNVTFSGVSTEIISFDNNGDQQGGYVLKNLQQNASGDFVFSTIGHWDEIPSDFGRSTPLEISGAIQWSHDRGDEVPESLCSHPCGNGEQRIPVTDQVECCWRCVPCPGTTTVSTGVSCMTCDLGYTPNEQRTECVLIEPSYLTWSDGWSIAVLILTCIGIIATTAVAVIFIVFHKHQLIKASSRELSAVLLTGIMLCYILPFFFIAKPAPWICAVRRFGVGFCFALCYSALLVKTNRIHRIFNRSPNSTSSPPLISPRSQLFFTALLVSVQIVIAVVWLVIERPGTVHEFSLTRTELKCSENPIAGLSITLGYNFILLLITLYFAFRTRKVPQNFNEAKFINFTIYTLCVLWLAFIPTYYSTASLGTVFQTGSLTLVIILNAFITLFILFVPKIYFLFSHQIRGKSASNGTESNTYQREKSRLGSIDKQFSSLAFLSSGSSSIKMVEGAPNNHSGLPTVAEGDVGGKDGEETSSETAKLLVDASTQTLG